MLRSLINQRLGRYYIKELLGRGGMAAVYRAADTTLQRDVALKILYPQYSDDESLVLRFQREAVTAAALEHPSIVPVYDVGEQDGMAYIAMKLLSGETLQDRLQAAGAIGLDELLAVLVPVAAALDYAHARGIVHRDIKPGNIFLSDTPDGRRVMLTDFGIAKQLDTPGLTTTGALIGTPDYMAPEQIAGRPVDARTDVYALGMLAYRALTGRRAYEGATQDVLLGHLYNRPAPPSQVNPALPPAVDAVIDRATAPEAAERFASAGALAAALAQVAREQAAGTAVGLPPALVPPPTSQAPTQRQPPPPPPRTPPAEVLRAAGPPRPAAAAVGETSGAATFAGPATAPSGAAPWLVAIAFALVAGALGTALFFALGRAGGVAAGPTQAPPPPPTVTASPTPEPPSATAEPAAVATATGAPTASPTATAEQASPTTAPSATPAPAPPSATPPPPPPPPPPSATPTQRPTESPTPTASPTSTASPTPTESPTPEASCDLGLLTGGFGRVYDEQVTVRTQIGCPLEREVAGPGSEQFYERGMMFYWDNSNETANADFIYVLYGADSGEFDALSPDEVAALGPDPTPGPDPSQPRRGFGRVYFYKDGVSDLLGAWTSPEIPLQSADRLAVMQRFEKGMMLYTPIYQPTSGRSIFVLYNDGRFDRFDDTFGG